MDSACAGISTRGMGMMREALKRWEQKQGMQRPKFGSHGFSDKRPKFTKPKPEPKPKPAPKPSAIKVPRDIAKPKKPRAPRYKYDPAIPRHKRPHVIAYRRKWDAENPLTEEQKAACKARSKAYRANYSPERKAAEIARIKAWKQANKSPANRSPG